MEALTIVGIPGRDGRVRQVNVERMSFTDHEDPGCAWCYSANETMLEPFVVYVTVKTQEGENVPSEDPARVLAAQMMQIADQRALELALKLLQQQVAFAKGRLQQGPRIIPAGPWGVS